MTRHCVTPVFAMLGILVVMTASPALGMQDSSTVYHAITEIHPARAAAGDIVMIRGVGFPMAPWRTQLEMDGQEVPLQHYEILSPMAIRVTLPSNTESGTLHAAGEWEHTVAVLVDGEASNSASFVEVRWGIIAQPRVFVPVLIYVVLVIGSFLLMGGGLFQSASGNLSLSKIQMGVWILVFSFSYALLASIWRDFIPLTPGMLWLLGISSVTAVGAKVIARKNDPTPPIRSRASRVCSEMHPTLGVYKCEIHRCQIMLWTLIVMVVFVVKLVSTLHLPDIPGALLILMGVGGGTYLGFKYPKTVVRMPSSGSSDKSQSGSKTWRKRPPRRSRSSTSSSSGGEKPSR